MLDPAPTTHDAARGSFSPRPVSYAGDGFHSSTKRSGPFSPVKTIFSRTNHRLAQVWLDSEHRPVPDTLCRTPEFAASLSFVCLIEAEAAGGVRVSAGRAAPAPFTLASSPDRSNACFARLCSTPQEKETTNSDPPGHRFLANPPIEKPISAIHSAACACFKRCLGQGRSPPAPITLLKGFDIQALNIYAVPISAISSSSASGFAIAVAMFSMAIRCMRTVRWACCFRTDIATIAAG